MAAGVRATNTTPERRVVTMAMLMEMVARGMAWDRRRGHGARVVNERRSRVLVGALARVAHAW